MDTSRSKPFASQLETELADAIDELTECVAAGELPDLDAICRRCPAAETELRRLYPTIAAMADLGNDKPTSSSAAPSSTTHGPVEQWHGIDQGNESLGDFVILRELGRGGMGLVYEAKQRSLNRRVALKVLPFASALDQRSLQRFKNEAQAAAMLKHANVVSVYAVGSDRGTHFYAMELIEGRTLSDLIAELRERANDPTQVSANSRHLADSDRTRPNAPSTTLGNRRDHNEHYRNVVRLGIDVCHGLQHAHEQGVIHRDVKPSNLIIDTQGKVSITDFGLAQIHHSSSKLTMTGDLLGTLRYMSPEQLDGAKLLDGRTDIYSLGLVLYEYLTLRPGFDDSERTSLLHSIQHTDPRPPRSIDPSIPVDLETVVLKAITKEPEARYGSATELADDLERVLQHKPIVARRSTWRNRSIRWVRRNPLVASLSTSIIGLLLILAIVASLAALRHAALADNAQAMLRESNSRNYALTTSAAYQAWEQGDVDRAESLLSSQRYLLARGGSSPFEFWHLWNSITAIARGDAIQLPPIEGEYDQPHANVGHRMAVSPDGYSIAIWNVRTRACEQTVSVLKPGEQRIRSITLSDDAKTVVAGTTEGALYIVDLANSSVRVKLQGAESGIINTAISHDGRMLFTTNFEDDVQHWPIADADSDIQPVTIDHWDSRGSPRIALSPDSSLIAVAGRWSGPVVHIRRLPDLELIKTLVVSPKLHYCVPLAFSADGSMLVAAGKTVSIWRTSDWSVIDQFDNEAFGRSSHVAINDKYLAVSDHSLIRVYDIAARRNLEVLRGHRAPLVHLGFSNTSIDDVLISSDQNGRIKTWPVSRWERLDEQQAVRSGQYTGVCFAQNNSRPLLIASVGQSLGFEAERGQLIRFDLDNGRSQLLRDGSWPHGAIAACPSHPELVAVATKLSDERRVVLLWDTERSQELGTLVGHQQFINEVVFSPDGKYLATADTPHPRPPNPQLIVWDVESQTPLHVLRGDTAWGLSFSPDGATLAVIGGEWGRPGQVRFLDLSSGKWRPVQFPCAGAALSVRYSPDGKSLAVGEEAGVLSIWDVEKQQRRFQLAEKQGCNFNCLAVSPDGQTLAVGDVNRHVSLWHMETGSQLTSWKTQRIAISMQFSPDGEVLAVGFADGLVWTWNIQGQHAQLQTASVASESS